MHDSFSSSCSQIVSVCLQVFHHNSPLKCAPQPKIARKTKTPFFGGLRSSRVIDVNTAKKLVTSACYDNQHVYAYLQLFSC